MRKTISLAALAAALTIAAPAAAAPDHSFAGGTEPESFPWDGAAGFGLADIQPLVGCQEHANCDFMLFEVKEAGTLTLQTTGNEDTLIDGDIHVYLSDEAGTEGEEIAAATNFTPNETLPVGVEPGYYLMMYAYSGLGTYDGLATWEPVAPPDEVTPVG